MKPTIKTLKLLDAFETLDIPGLERNLFSSSSWMKVLLKTYPSLKLFLKYIEENGKIRSYIIYSVVENFLDDKVCICSYCDYCDGYVHGKEDWEIFFLSIKEEYFGYRIAIRNLRDEFVRSCGFFEVLSKEKFHMIDIRDDLDILWKRTHDSFRNAVKQAQKNGLVTRVCSKKDLKSFYSLHLKVRKNKYKIFPQPYKFFENIWETFMEKGKGYLLGVFTPEGKFVGGNIYLLCGNAAYYKFNTSDIKSINLRPNNFLFWEGIKLAKEKGSEFVDLGSSGYDQKGLILFKEHAGAKAQDIIHLGYNPPDYKYSSRFLLKIFTKFCTFRWMPDFVTRLGSRFIYPFLA